MNRGKNKKILKEIFLWSSFLFLFFSIIGCGGGGSVTTTTTTTTTTTSTTTSTTTTTTVAPTTTVTPTTSTSSSPTTTTTTSTTTSSSTTTTTTTTSTTTTTTGSPGVLWEQVTPTPAFAGRRSGGCEVIDSSIYLFGGQIDLGGEMDTNEVIAIDANGAVSSFFADFTPRRNISTVQHDGKIWLVGGTRGEDRLSDVWSAVPYGEFELVTSETAIGSVESCMLLSFGGQLFLLGGETDEEDDYSRKVWSSDDGITWDQTHEFDDGMIRSASVFSGYLYALIQTGESEAFLYNQVWRSTNGSNWENIALASWNFSPGNFQMPVFSGRMWVLGGVTEEGDSQTYYRQVWSSADGINWSMATAEAPWVGRTEGFIGVLSDKLWLIGGEGESSYLGDIWRTPAD